METDYLRKPPTHCVLNGQGLTIVEVIAVARRYATEVTFRSMLVFINGVGSVDK